MANVKGWIKNFYSRGKGRAIYAKDNIKEKVVNTKDNLKRRHHERKNTREQRRGGISTAKAEKRDLNTAYTETLSNERLSLEEKRARLQEIAEQRDQQKQVLPDYRAQRTAGLRNAKDKVKTGTNAVGRAVNSNSKGGIITSKNNRVSYKSYLVSGNTVILCQDVLSYCRDLTSNSKSKK